MVIFIVQKKVLDFKIHILSYIHKHCHYVQSAYRYHLWGNVNSQLKKNKTHKSIIQELKKYSHQVLKVTNLIGVLDFHICMYALRVFAYSYCIQMQLLLQA